jgi:hypothetical protein
VEATVIRAGKAILVQWTRDSAYRFFPLIEDERFGLTLHPFDLATNKVLALVGRLEVRDWIDVIQSHEKVQNLGYLIWAACGKDPGFSPSFLLAEAKRSNRHTAEDVSQLSFEGLPPDVGELNRAWHDILKEAEQIISMLPLDGIGKCVLNADEKLFKGDQEVLRKSLDKNEVMYHSGQINGAWPQFPAA